MGEGLGEGGVACWAWCVVGGVGVGGGLGGMRHVNMRQPGGCAGRCTCRLHLERASDNRPYAVVKLR